MAYDPNDPADKKIVDDAVKAALAEKQEEHEADTAGLKAKNKQLLEKIAKGENGDSAAELARVESELETAKKALKESDKLVKSLTGERDTFKANSEKEAKISSDLLVKSGLTAELARVKVAPQFLPAVEAMLQGKVTLVADGETRKAMVGDKPLGEFVTAWSQGDEGKHYIAAAANGGGGAGGAKGGEGGKSMTRTAYDEMQNSDPGAAAKFFSEGGTLTDG